MTTRDAILDAAARVMREQGIARATTKAIAAASGYSEALLYKHFDDKQALYLAVLKERSGSVGPEVQPGTGDVRRTLVDAVVGLMDFYMQSFPMSASIFSDRVLLETWRDGMTARGAGPRGPIRALQRYVQAEVDLGRLSGRTDAAGLAALLCGAAFQSAFLACFDGAPEVPRARELAEAWVRAVVE